MVQDIGKKTYPATFALFGWLALAGTAILSAVLLLAVHPKHSAPDALLTNEVPGAIVCTAFLSFFFQLARCRVIATSTALIVVNPIRRYMFPWGQVADVAVGRDGGLRLLLRDRTSFPVFGFGGSLVGMMTGGIHAKKVRDGITAIMAATTQTETEHEPVTYANDLQWKVTAAIWLALTVLACCGWLLAPNHVLA